MTDVSVVVEGRPVVVEVGVGETTLRELLAAQARVRGRASRWGVTDALLADYLVGGGPEADFIAGYYRSGFVEGATTATLNDFQFTRTGSGTARNAAGQVLSFATGVPRVTDVGLLIEPAATNRILRSQDLSVSPWASTNMTATANAATAPDGTTTATKLEMGSGAAAGARHQQIITAVGASVTGSVFAKKGSGPNEANLFRLYNAFTGANPLTVALNFDTGAVTYLAGSSGATVEAHSDGWWRISLSSAGHTAGDLMLFEVGGANLPDTPGRFSYWWGAQYEDNPAPSSYIPTTSAAVTRGADLASFAAALGREGTLIAEVRRGVPSGLNETVLGNASARLLNLIGASTNSTIDSVSLTLGTAPLARSVGKVGLTWKPGRRAGAVNGGAVASDAISPVLGSRLYLGCRGSGNQLGGYVRSVLHLPAALSDAALQGLTV